MAADVASCRSLTMVLSAEPASLDPIHLQGVQNWAESIAASAVFDQLFYPRAEGGIAARIGTSLNSPDGGRTWELGLRPGVRFSDGTRFDSEAVRFNWERVRSAERAPARAVAAMIERMEVLDPLNLRISLVAPMPRWDLLVARSLATIGSAAALADNADGFASTPVGAGPFVLAEWSKGEFMHFVRNPDYWRPGKPHLDEITVLTGINDAAAKFEVMVSGKAQVALEPMGGNIAKYRAQPERFTLMPTPENGGGVALAMNLSRAPFDDARLRKALALTFTSEEFVERAGYSDPHAVMTTIDRPNTRCVAADVRLPQRDLPAAQALIDQIVAERGGPVRFAVETFPNEGHLREAHAVKGILEQHLSGMEIEVSVGTVADLSAKWQSGEFQASNHAVKWSEPALDLPAQFGSSSPMNIMRYHSEAVDQALADLTAATSEAERTEAHLRVLRQILEDNPVIWLARKDAYHVVDRSVEGWSLFYSLRPLLEDVRRAGRR